MKDPRFSKRSRQVAAAVVLAGAFLGAAATVRAQGPGGPPPGFGGGPGGPGGPGRGPRPVTVANVPVDALAAGLRLSADQVTKITAIQERLQQQRQELLPRPGDGPGGPGDDGAPPPPPDRETMQANRDKMRTFEQNAVRDIRAILSDEQKQALPALLKELEDLRSVGITAELAVRLNLSSDQKTQIAAIAQKAQQTMRRQRDGAALRREDFGAMREAMQQARAKTQEQVQAVLTETQRAEMAKFLREHPRPERGGPGGPGPDDHGGPPPV